MPHYARGIRLTVQPLSVNWHPFEEFFVRQINTFLKKQWLVKTTALSAMYLSVAVQFAQPAKGQEQLCKPCSWEHKERDKATARNQFLLAILAKNQKYVDSLDDKAETEGQKIASNIVLVNLELKTLKANQTALSHSIKGKNCKPCPSVKELK